MLQDGESGRCPEGFSAVPEGCPAARGRSVSSERGAPTGAKPFRVLPGVSVRLKFPRIVTRGYKCDRRLNYGAQMPEIRQIPVTLVYITNQDYKSWHDVNYLQKTQNNLPAYGIAGAAAVFFLNFEKTKRKRNLFKEVEKMAQKMRYC